jgi:triosephosphate isomerase
MKKTKIIIANWKMNILTEKEAKKLVSSVKRKVINSKNTVVFCPPFVYLSSLKNISSKKIFLGAQNINSQEKGSFTGEVSVSHIQQYKVSYCIVGHSERRKIGESDNDISKKVSLCLTNRIKPILCVGETTRDDGGEYLKLIKDQIKTGLSLVSKSDIGEVLIAYEPVYSIGTGVSMHPTDIHEMVLWIKKCLKELYGDFSLNTKIIYGGSVNALNALDIVDSSSVDSLLVGKDSLDAESFSKIINNIK